MLMPQTYGHFIDGAFVPSESGETLDSINPSNGSIAAKIAKGTAADVATAVASAKAASSEWANMRPLDRGRILIDMGRKLRDNMGKLAKLESDEMGAPMGGAAMALGTAAAYFEYYGGLAPSLQGETIPVGPDKHSYTVHEPYGVVGVITPWNAPLNQTARSIAPALAAGNCVVHKPSEYTSVTALVFAQIAHECGLPKGVWNVVTGLGADVGDALVRHSDISKVAFTGSMRTGQAIGAIAAEKIMTVTLELGGKSPDIVFEDADLQAATMGVLLGFIGNSGQVCLAGSRVLIQRSIYDKFSEMLVGASQFFAIGKDKPMPSLGPIANKDQYEKVLSYFEVAKEDGAKLLTGGEKAEGEGLENGYYVKPTIYGDVNNDMRIAREEIFGPVGVLIPFDTEEEAIAIANDTEYGLAAGVWTQNLSRAHRVAGKIQAGQIYVNYYLESGVEHPMGGYKKSGVGREKGMVALKQYTQLKNIAMKLS
ncbi:aldehyde dehydrogenase [Maricurvus nonylphenolicus]|uniref:aldehyde dehydrogenase family protein n=1 Tax=Maricurvus nonylphenolicus TaxID=1008307 RepID=UPI0036F36384